MLAGRCAATLTVGNCGISPYLENYFRSPVYSVWLESDLFAGGCDPTYESLSLAPIEAASTRFAHSCFAPQRVDNEPSVPGFESTGKVMPSANQLAKFLEDMVGGHGRGGQFAGWVREAFAPSDIAYQMIKRQAHAGADRVSLDNAERAMLAAMLKHGGLDADAMLISSKLGDVCKNGSAGDARGRALIRKPPRWLGVLWASVAKVRARFAVYRHLYMVSC